MVSDRIKFLKNLHSITYQEAQSHYTRMMDSHAGPHPGIDAWEDALRANNAWDSWERYCENQSIPTDKSEPIVCEKCRSLMILKGGKHGPFMGCVNYPKCDWCCDIPKSIDSRPVEATLVERIKAACIFIDVCGGLQCAKTTLAAIEKMK